MRTHVRESPAVRFDKSRKKVKNKIKTGGCLEAAGTWIMTRAPTPATSDLELKHFDFFPPG
jgi:hypothetical protein